MHQQLWYSASGREEKSKRKVDFAWSSQNMGRPVCKTYLEFVSYLEGQERFHYLQGGAIQEIFGMEH
jgi:hypothetical protein